jgi:cell division protein FtsW (lipid II flippase)
MANAHDFIMTLPDVSEIFITLFILSYIIFCSNMRLKWVKVEVHFQVARNKELVSDNRDCRV